VACASQGKRAEGVTTLRGQRRISSLSAVLRLPRSVAEQDKRTHCPLENRHENRMGFGSLYGVCRLWLCDEGIEGGRRPDAAGGARHDSARTGRRRTRGYRQKEG